MNDDSPERKLQTLSAELAELQKRLAQSIQDLRVTQERIAEIAGQLQKAGGVEQDPK